MAMTPEEKREYMRRWRAENRDKLAGYRRKHAVAAKIWRKKKDQTPEGKAKRAAYRKKHREQLAAKQRVYTKANPEKARTWNAANPEKVRASQRKFREANPEKVRAYSRRYHKKNPEKDRERCSRYHRENSGKIRAQREERMNNDPNFKLALQLRSRLYGAIKNGQKAGSAVDDLGCMIPELRAHLEAQFSPGMTWDNWSRDGWHLDHVQPLASYDLTDRDQFLAACHYTNLAPLWAKDNLRKGARV